jgi:disulfide bond formation protein DsbB
MTSIVQTLLIFLSRHLPWIILAASVFSLVFAYTMQYGFGFRPCELCLMQRPPYFAAIVLSTLSLLSSRASRVRGTTRDLLPQKQMKVPDNAFGVSGMTRFLCLALCAVAFAIGGAIGTYQVGVEYHWWAGPSGCSGSLAGLTATEILEQIEGAATVRCDDVQFRFLGMSMAAMNALWSFALAGAVILGMVSSRKNHPVPPA